MARKQLLLLGVGIFLAAGAMGAIAARRALEQNERNERSALGEDDVSELVPLPRPEPGEPLRPPPAGQGKRPSEAGVPEALGPFTLVVTGAHSAMVTDLSGEEVVSSDSYVSAELGRNLTINGQPVLLFTEKPCEDPCNPTSRLFVLRGRRGEQIAAFSGVAELQDLDRDGVPELILDHLMQETQEVVTLPYRLDAGRFVNAYDRHPDGVDRQVEGLRKAVEQDCNGQVTRDCQAELRALLGLSAFRHDKTPVADTLRIERTAKDFCSRETVLEIQTEISALDES